MTFRDTFLFTFESKIIAMKEDFWKAEVFRDKFLNITFAKILGMLKILGFKKIFGINKNFRNLTTFFLNLFSRDLKFPS